jgi:hypothetical protein
VSAVTIVDDNPGMSAAPAAWYPCPQFEGLLRWWDGRAWTVHTVHPLAPVPEVVLPTPPPVRPVDRPAVSPAVAPAMRPVVELPAKRDFEFAPYTPMDDSSHALRYGHSRGRGPTLLLPPVRGSLTVWAWLIAIVPSILAAGLVAFVLSFGDPTAAWRYYIWVLVIVLVSLFLAARDGRELRRRGYPIPGWGWVLIPVIYLVARSVALGRSSLWPLLGWLVAQVVLAAVLAALYLPQLVVA